MIHPYDVFLSHAWGDHLDDARVRERPPRSGVERLRDALRASGLRVFYDEGSIDDFAPLAATILDGLQSSTVFVAWCSDLYLTRPACASELATATTWSGDEAGGRVLIVNTEADVAHLPTPLRAHLVPAAPDPDDDAAFEELVARIVARCAELDGSIGDGTAAVELDWFPERVAGSTRFTGRFRELWELHGLLTSTALQGSKDTRRGAVVSGMGGSGKSLLVIEYAHRFGAAWPGGVVFLTGHGADRDDDRISSTEHAAAALRELAAIDLKIELPPAAGLAEIRDAIQRWFADRGPALWIVDDLADDADHADVAAWVAPMDDAATLLTTRVRTYDGLFEPLRLDSLSPDDALALLTRDVAPANETERSAAQTIVERLGRNALAVDVTRTRIRAADDYGTLLARLEADAVTAVERAGARVGALVGDHTPSITATLQRSIDELSEGHGLGQRVLEVAACFDSLPIPDDTIAGVLADSETFGADALADPEDVGDGIHDLVNHSLARRDERTVTVHRLVVDLARPSEHGWREQVFSAAERALCDALDDVHDERTLHSRRAHHELAATLDVGPESDLPIWMARYEIGVGAPRIAIEHLERLVAARRDRPDEDRAATLEAQHELANAYDEAGDHARAVELHSENFVEREELLGPSHPVTLDSGHGLAVARFWNEEDSAEFLQAIRNLRSDELGEWHEDTLMTQYFLARAMVEDGDLDEGIELLEATLEGQRSELGADHIDTLETEVFLADARLQLGDLDTAIAGFERVLEVAETTFGPTHRSVVASLTLLADALHERGDSDRALELARRAAEDGRRAMGLDHPYTHQAFDLVAMLHLDAGDASAAKAALDATDGHRNPEHGHPETLRWRRLQGDALAALGEQQRAIEVYETLLAELREFYVSNADLVKEVRAALDELYRATGDRWGAAKRHLGFGSR